MANSTIGVKIDDSLKERLKSAALTTGSTPHGLIKKSIVATLERIESGDAAGKSNSPSQSGATGRASQPFLAFAQDLQPQSVLRARITAAYRVPEPDCVPVLCAEARLPAETTERAQATARKLVEDLRAKTRRGGVEGLLQEYSLSSQEGVALMCLAEALLRIPDRATRDALIRDKIALGDWSSHLGQSPSMFVNAATWGLVVTGKLTTTASENGPRRGLDPDDRQGRRTADPQRHRFGHADDGRAVRHRADHRRSSGQQPQERRARFPLFL